MLVKVFGLAIRAAIVMGALFLLPSPYSRAASAILAVLFLKWYLEAAVLWAQMIVAALALPAGVGLYLRDPFPYAKLVGVILFFSGVHALVFGRSDGSSGSGCSAIAHACWRAKPVHGQLQNH